MIHHRISSCIILFCSIAATQAQLVVMVMPPEVVGQKVVVKLTMTNNLPDTVEFARAACFLLDGQSKMIGQSTKWVIGQNKATLEPKDEAKFNFVITATHLLVSSNLTAKVIFSRLVLDDGKAADVRQNVDVIPVNPANSNTKSQ